MTKLKLLLVGGARPNFMKLAPIIRAVQRYPQSITYSLVHTGQHYDHEMSQVFFDELGIPTPDYHLDIKATGQTQQMARIMMALEPIYEKEEPDLVIVVGDVTSTLAATLVAKQHQIAVAHVEAGLRSFDRSMPEEINRLATDAISDDLFASEESAVSNLKQEGHDGDHVFFVGQVMVDNLLYQVHRLDHETALQDERSLTHSIPLKRQYPQYGVVTLHRASNTDCIATLTELLTALNAIAERLPLMFPIHPRTRHVIDQTGLTLSSNIVCLPPLPYMDFLNLWRDATLVLTDSGGLQEETTALGVPCLTLRENTERPITIECGTNQLVGTNAFNIVSAAEVMLSNERTEQPIKRPPYWDGKAAERIIEIILQRYGKDDS